MNSCASEEWAVPAPSVAPFVLGVLLCYIFGPIHFRTNAPSLLNDNCLAPNVLFVSYASPCTNFSRDYPYIQMYLFDQTAELKFYQFTNDKITCNIIRLISLWHRMSLLILRRACRYKKGNQNPLIEKEQTTQWPNEKQQNDKQRSTKHPHKTKDRVARTPLKQSR